VSRPPARFRTGGVSLRRRVTVAFLVVGALVAATLGFTAWTFSSMLDARHRLIDQLDPAVLAGRDVHSALLTQASGVRGFALAGDEPFLEPYNRGRADEVGASQRLQRAIGADPQLQLALADTLERAAEWRQTSAVPIIAAVREGGAKAATPALLGESERRFDAFSAASATLEAALDTEQRVANDRLDTATRRLVQVAAGGLIFAIVGGFVLWRALARWVLAPLESLGDQTRPRS
jgi:CHASE3 domain sensor protein